MRLGVQNVHMFHQLAIVLDHERRVVDVAVFAHGQVSHVSACDAAIVAKAPRRVRTLAEKVEAQRKKTAWQRAYDRKRNGPPRVKLTAAERRVRKNDAQRRARQALQKEIACT